MEVPPGIKLESSCNYPSKCFPVRPLLKQGEGQADGAWLVAQKAEQKRRFKAVICTRPRSLRSLKEKSFSTRDSPGKRAPPATILKQADETEMLDESMHYSTARPEMDWTAVEDVGLHRPAYDDDSVLDGFYLLRRSHVDDPSDLCVINIAGEGLSEARPEDFSLFVNVIRINASENLLPLGVMAGFPALQELEMPMCGLHNLNIMPGDLPNLEYLDVSYNSLSIDDILSIGLLPKLRRLHLSGNNLHHLPEDMSVPELVDDGIVFPRFYELEILMLDDNRLSDPSIFATLAGLRRLRILNLERNQIRSVPILRNALAPSFQPEPQPKGNSRPSSSRRTRSARSRSFRHSSRSHTPQQLTPRPDRADGKLENLEDTVVMSEEIIENQPKSSVNIVLPLLNDVQEVSLGYIDTTLPTVLEESVAAENGLESERENVASVANEAAIKEDFVSKYVFVEGEVVPKNTQDEDQSVAKDLPCKDQSAAKDVPSKDQSVAKDVPSEDQSVAKDVPSEDQSVAKDVPSEYQSVAKDVPSEDQSVAKDVPSEDQSVAKDVQSEDQSVAKDVQSEDQSVAKNVLSEDQSVAKDVSSEDQSVSKDVSSEDQSVAKDVQSEDQSDSKDVSSEDQSVAKDVPSEDPSVAKDEPPENETVAKDNTSENKFVVKDYPPEDQTVAKNNASEDPSVAKDDPSEVKNVLTEGNSVQTDLPVDEVSVAMVSTVGGVTVPYEIFVEGKTTNDNIEAMETPIVDNIKESRSDNTTTTNTATGLLSNDVNGGIESAILVSAGSQQLIAENGSTLSQTNPVFCDLLAEQLNNSTKVNNQIELERNDEDTNFAEGDTGFCNVSVSSPIEEINNELLDMYRPSSAPRICVEKTMPSARSIEELMSYRQTGANQIHPPPFHQLTSINLANNLISQEEDVLPVAGWPSLRQVVLHDNPLVRLRSGDPPLLASILRQHLGVEIVRSKPAFQSRPPPTVSNKRERKIVEKIPKMIRCDVTKLVQAIEAPSALSGSSPLPDIPTSRPSGQEEIPVVADEEDAVDKETFFMTQLDEELAGTLEDGLLSARQEVQHEADNFAEEEEILSARGGMVARPPRNSADELAALLAESSDDPSLDGVPLPKDVPGSIRALEFILSHPVTITDRIVTLDRPQPPMPLGRKGPLGPRPIPETRAELIDKTLFSQRDRPVQVEAPLVEVLAHGAPEPRSARNTATVSGSKSGRETAVVSHPAVTRSRGHSTLGCTLPPVALPKKTKSAVRKEEAEHLLQDIQRKYNNVRSTSMQVASQETKEHMQELITDIQSQIRNNLQDLSTSKAH